MTIIKIVQTYKINMRILVSSQDEYSSKINIDTFYDWEHTIPFCEYLHKKNLFVNIKSTFL